uniref:Cyclic nucleotide-binding domain-containing protein n=1 Tax=Lotharella globosa TaxID=91324 RepID=A0A7S3YQX1_9EUKA
MTALASKPDSATMQFREHLDDVAVFMKQNNVPVPLRAQVINFLKLQNAMKVTHGNEMINKLPSAIKMPIKRHQYEDILGTVDIFRGVSKPFLAMLMANVEEEIFMAGMPVINCADRCSAFYIITSGQCEVMVSPTGTNQVKMDNELQGARIEAGGHFGSEGFFSSSNQPFTIKVSKLCCCIKVENEVRKEIMTAFPRDIQVVIINIKRRLELMLELLSTGLKKKEEEELKAQAEVLEGNYLPGVAEKKSALKSTPMPFLDYQPPKRGRGRRRRKSTRTIHNFNITNFTRPFMRSVHETRNNVVLYMERHEQDIAATLCQLASVGDHQNLRSMLYGLDLSSDTGDYDGRVPLHLACARGHLEACKVLLKYKANPSHADHFGVTPLQECVKGGHDEVVAYMLRKGAKLAMKDVGGYMCSVAFVGDNKTVERLLKAKADPNAADYDGRTAFHLGCVEGNLSVVKILLHFKANPHLADRWGQTPLSEAKRVGHDVIVRVMMSALKDSAEDATSTQDTANEKDGGTAAAAATTATFAAAATTTGVSSSSSKDSKGTPAPKEAQNKTKGGSKDAETKAAAAAAAQSSPRKPAKARKKKKKPSRPDLSTIISDSPSGNQPGGDKAQEGGGAANEQNLFSPLSPVQMASTPVSKVTPMPQTPDDAGSQEAKSLSGGDKRTIKVGTSLVGGLSDGPNNTTMCATPKTEDSPSNVERKRLIDKGSSS